MIDCSVSSDQEVSATPADKGSRCSRFLQKILSVSHILPCNYIDHKTLLIIFNHFFSNVKLSLMNWNWT